MTTLETLRTKAGVFVSIVIGIALLAFIINADTLATARAIFSSADDMGKIAGNTISREEFENMLEYNTELYKISYSMYSQETPPMNDRVNESLRNKTWQDLISKYVRDTEYQKIGLAVSETELTDLTVTGTNLSPIITQIFTNPETGTVDRSQLQNFVTNMDGIAKIWWIDLEKQITDEQLFSRYSQLDAKSNYVNSLDVEHILNGEKNNIEFSYILKDYASTPDSLISYREADIKDYYNKNKQKYKTTRSRDIEFIAFTVTPSANDYEKVMYKMEELQTKMDTLAPSAMYPFVRRNSDVAPDSLYYKKGELPAVLDSVVFNRKAGEVLPYYQEGDTYNLAGIVGFRTMPDSVKADHILFSPENTSKVDSVFDLLKKGASFAELAKQFGTDGTVANGGELGWFTFKSMVRPFSDSCFFKPVGSLMKVKTQHGMHIVKIRDAKLYNNRVQLATVKKTVTPSQGTYQTFYAQANKIAAQGKDGITKFRAACAEEGLQPRLENNISLESKTVAQYQKVSNLIRWMYEAKEGDVSGVLEIDDKQTYIVAALVAARESGISPVEKVRNRIVLEVVKNKKAEYLIAQISDARKDASSIDEVATKLGVSVTSVSPAINFNSSYIPTLRTTEYKLLGAVTSSSENQLSEPVAGESGVYLYLVTSIAENPQAQTPEAIKSRLESNNYSTLYRLLYEKADIVDNRGRFY
ncbi:MAG: SurA N-terminal domain-containing protein [Prevotellaceae bacterium]|jgi:peptidyl-prolyl cis-trans isomerase D|nr:SurA N-terminal domain-containing protein [Prevotellaceae bacterium]